MSEVTAEGSRLITQWLRCADDVRRAKSTLSRAECDEANTQAELAKWLMPSDMKPGEKVAVWFGDSLLQVEMKQREAFEAESGVRVLDYEPKVTVRTRGKHFSQLSQNR